MNFSAKKTDIQLELLKDKKLLKNMGNILGYPYNIIIPEEIKANITSFETVFKNHNMNYKIFFAHKCNKSSAVIKECLYNNISVSACSLNELKHSLSCGYQGKNILANGPKNKDFTLLAIQHNVNISVDNMDELIQTNELAIKLNVSVNILLRINNIDSDNIKKESKFGFDNTEFKKALYYINDNNKLNLIGLEIHLDTINIKEKISGVAKCIKYITKLIDMGFDIRVLDIGGGFPINYLDNRDDYDKSVSELKDSFASGKYNLTWDNYTYGIRVDKGVLRGDLNTTYLNEIAKDEYLKNIIEAKVDGRMICDIINDLGLQIWIEPGKAILDNVGLDITRVNFVKEIDNKKIVGLEMKKSDLTLMGEVFADPICLNDNDKENVFLSGNLCRENDFIYQRVININSPKVDDLIVFFNTAPYLQDFEVSETAMHDVAKKIIIRKGKNGFELFSDEEYNPFIK